MKLKKFFYILDEFEKNGYAYVTSLKVDDYNEKNKWITNKYNDEFKKICNKTNRKKLKIIYKYQIAFNISDEKNFGIYVCSHSFSDVCKLLLEIEMILYKIEHDDIDIDLKNFTINKIEMLKASISKENSLEVQETCKNLESSIKCLDHFLFPRDNQDVIKQYCENICEQIDKSYFSYFVLNERNSLIDMSKNILYYVMLWKKERT